MADGLVLNNGSGGATLLTDEIPVTLQHKQLVGIVDATADSTNRAVVDGSGNLQVKQTANMTVVGAAADGAAASGNPVLIAGFDGTNAQSIATTAGGLVQIHDASGSITVDNAGTFAVQDTANGTLIGAVTEAAPASDTASSGLNGRLQRIAQRLTSLIALLPASLGQKTMANGLAVTVASDQSAIPSSQSGTWTVQPGNTANTTAWKVDGSAVTQPVSGTFWQATQPVSGTVAVSGTVTVDSELTTADLDTGAGTDTRAVVGLVTAASGGGTLVSAANPLPIAIISGAGSGGTAIADNATFTPGTTSFTPIGGEVDDTGSTDATENSAGAVRMTVKRAIHVNLRDATGAELSVGGGTQYDEDAVSAGAEKVTMAGVVRRDTAASSSGTDGDISTLATDATGRLWAHVGTVDGGTITTVSTVTNLSQLGGTAVAMNTGVRAAGVQRVTIATDDVVPITDNSGSLTVDAPVGTPAFVRLSDGAAAITTLPVSLAANQSVNVAQVGGNATSTAASGVQKVGVVGNGGATVDSTVAAGAAPTNQVVVGSVYNTSAPAPTNGQAMAQQADQAGNLNVAPGIATATLSAWTSATALNTTQSIFTKSGAQAVLLHLVQTSTLTVGAVTVEVSYDGTNYVTISSDCVLDPTSATLATIALPYTLQASTNKAFLLLVKGAQAMRLKLSTAITGTATVTPNYALLPYAAVQQAILGAGSATIGALAANQSTNVAQLAGTTTDTNSGNKSAGTLRVVLATDQPALTTAMPVSLATVPSHAVTNAGTFAVQAVDAGDVAHDGADSGNPVKVGGRARSSEITAVANNDRSDLITDLVGKLITLPYANPENFVSGAITTAMTGTTTTSLVAAPAAGLRNYITTIVASNSHATVGTDIAIQDGSGGTTLMTIPAAALYGGAVINLPVPLRQPTTATAIFCANVTTGASTKVSAVGYKGA